MDELRSETHGLQDLAEAVEGMQVRFRPDLPVHSILLLAAMGVEIIFDATAPARCECAGCRGPK